jgi:hypothetical protein
VLDGTLILKSKRALVIVRTGAFQAMLDRGKQCWET